MATYPVNSQRALTLCVTYATQWFLQIAQLLTPAKFKACVFIAKRRFHQTDRSRDTAAVCVDIPFSYAVEVLGKTPVVSLMLVQQVVDVICSSQLANRIWLLLSSTAANSMATSKFG
jgi:hypothetical protein